MQRKTEDADWQLFSAAGATCFGTGMMTNDSGKLAVESMDQARAWLLMLPSFPAL